MLTYLPWSQPSHWRSRPCMRDAAGELTYAEFAARVEAAAEQFTEYGVGHGSIVAVMLPNRVELLIAIVAAWRVGAAATPINPSFTANEAEYQITDADAALVVVSDADAPTSGRPMVRADDLRCVPTGRTLPPPPRGTNELALVIYTSGSTGRPKGVLLSHGNIAAMAASMVEALGLTEDDHCLLVLPLFHANAICVGFLATMMAGGQMSILARFKPVQFLETIERLRPTYFSAVPTIYTHLLTLPPEATTDTASVRFAICGAAPASPWLLEATEARFGFPIVEGYGLTEGTCASTANPVTGPRKPGTVGPALPGQTVAIMDPHGRLLPAGERGEVVIQGANVMQGYLNRPAATADALGDGWLHTGDAGILDEDGYLRIVDRFKDMIIRGGENIYPSEIEDALHQHPSVLEAAVVGAPDPVYGELPQAYVVLRPGDAADVDDIRALCALNLTKVKMPASITILDALPKNPVGKVDKPSLRAATASIRQRQGV